MSDVLFSPLPAKSTPAERAHALERLLEAFDFRSVVAAEDRTAIKSHFGERKNTTHVPPALLAPVVRKVKEAHGRPFLTETATLYKGSRSDAIAHLDLAREHGFTYEAVGCSIVLADGLLGDAELAVDIPGELFGAVHIARDIVLCDALVVVSHPTGHLLTGAGACIKNLGMGCASRKGKRAQHCSVKPSVLSERCRACGSCIRWCPQDAVFEGESGVAIDHGRCIGCGECLAVCRHDAISIDWRTDSAVVQRRMAEHALGAVAGKQDKCVFVNALIDMTGDCDCMAVRQTPVMGDVGFLLGTDPVAIDQATLDLTAQAAGKSLAELSHPSLDAHVQLAHGEKIGLGQRAYRLVKLDAPLAAAGR